MNHTIWNKYSKEFGVRFYRRQKRKAAKAIIEDFHSIGYEKHDWIKKQSLFGKAENFYIGNFNQAKTIFLVPYDTPQRMFFFKSYFYPLDGTSTMNKTFLPIFGPSIFIYLCMLFVNYFAKDFVTNANLLKVIVLLMSFLLLFLCYFMIKGFANPVNESRHSASIYTAYEIARRLSIDQKRKVAFLFLDTNKTKHYGAKIAAEYLETLNRQPNIIVLQTLGKGSITALGYPTHHKKIVQDLNKASNKTLHCKQIEMNESMRESTITKYFPKACVIANGELDEKQRILVQHTANKKDKGVDLQQLHLIVDMIINYLG